MSSPDAPNPYRSPAPVQRQGRLYGEAARRRAGGFLYREIELTGRVEGVLRYNGWWFVQRIHLDEQLLWRKISWLRIERFVEFTLPSVSGEELAASLHMEFDSRLRFRGFHLLADGYTLYEE